jgi:hypothetical protein
MSRVQRIDDPRDVVRPFLWIAGIFFNVGFWGFFGLRALTGA